MVFFPMLAQSRESIDFKRANQPVILRVIMQETGYYSLRVY